MTPERDADAEELEELDELVEKLKQIGLRARGLERRIAARRTAALRQSDEG